MRCTYLMNNKEKCNEMCYEVNTTHQFDSPIFDNALILFRAWQYSNIVRRAANPMALNIWRTDQFRTTSKCHRRFMFEMCLNLLRHFIFRFLWIHFRFTFSHTNDNKSNRNYENVLFPYAEYLRSERDQKAHLFFFLEAIDAGSVRNSIHFGAHVFVSLQPTYALHTKAIIERKKKCTVLPRRHDELNCVWVDVKHRHTAFGVQCK